MRTEIKVTEGGCGPLPDWIANQRAGVIAERVHLEPWIRLIRYTFDGDNQLVKRELGVFAARDGDFEIRWREFDIDATLTDIAPMSEYLVWEK